MSAKKMLCGCVVLVAMVSAAQAQWPRFRSRFAELPAKAHLDYGDRGAPWVTAAIALGDLDGDGDLDLVEGQTHDIFTLMENDGRAVFTNQKYRGPGDLAPPLSPVQAMALGDVDRDGDLDLVYRTQGQNRLYLNGGSWNFTPAAASHMPVHPGLASAMALGDVDLDGDLDLVLGMGEEEGAQNRLYLNDGAGHFTDATSARLPVDKNFTSSVALGDLDRDGDLDIVFGNLGGPGSAERNRIYVNDGQGAFSDATSMLPISSRFRTEAIVLGDLDRDGDLDLVEGNVGQNRVYVNDGRGRFVEGTTLRMPFDADATHALALGDLDADGDLDLVLGNDGLNRWYQNDGIGNFSATGTSLLPADRDETWTLELGDLDGDGDLDLVCGNESHNRVYLNEGSGAFISATSFRLPRQPVGATDLIFCDVDGDGDLDLVVGAGEPPELLQTRLYLNDGTGHFTDATASSLPVDGDITTAIACGDVDGDGDQDLLLANGGNRARTPNLQNRLYTNDGTGVFADVSATHLPADTDRSAALVLGDVDGDGDLDLVVGNVGAQDRLYLNDGTGRYLDATAQMPRDVEVTLDLVMGDVDGDADLDLVLGGVGQARLYVNDGAGSFAKRPGSFPATSVRALALTLVDMDRDGDLDLVFGSRFWNRLYVNDGSGRFSEDNVFSSWRGSGARGLATGDLNSDGTPDLVLATGPYNHNPLEAYANDGSGGFRIEPWFIGDYIYSASAVAMGDVDGDGDLDVAAATTSFLRKEMPGVPRLYLNLHVQVTPPLLPTLGDGYRLVVHALRSDYGFNGYYTVYPFLSFALAPSPTHIPSLGTVYLEPRGLIPLPRFLIDPTYGWSYVDITVPADPTLVGTTVHVQALIANNWNPLEANRLTTYTTDVILK